VREGEITRRKGAVGEEEKGWPRDLFLTSVYIINPLFLVKEAAEQEKH